MAEERTRYVVFVDDNFNYMDEDERVRLDSFDTPEAAVVACKALVEKELRQFHKPGMTAAELYDQYTSFGSDPWIRGYDFSAWTWARTRCEEICGGG